MKKPGLGGRRRDVGGEISRKHGNTSIGMLREVYGPDFAKGMQGDATVAEVLRIAGIEAISEEDRTLLLKGTINSLEGRQRLELVGAERKPVRVERARPKKEKPRSEAAFLDEITDWTGDRQEAEHWYRKVPIPAFGNRTADQVHADGMGDELGHYIEGLRSGEFA